MRVALLVDGRATLADIPNTLRGLLAAVGGRSLRRLPVEWCGLAYWTADHGEDHAEQLAAVIWAGGVPVDRVIVTGWSRGECALSVWEALSLPLSGWEALALLATEQRAA